MATPTVQDLVAVGFSEIAASFLARNPDELELCTTEASLSAINRMFARLKVSGQKLQSMHPARLAHAAKTQVKRSPKPKRRRAA